VKATRLDLLLIGIALVLTVVALTWRGLEYWRINSQTDEVFQNILAVAHAVHEYHDSTGRWFPEENDEGRPVQLYPDPFHHRKISTSYQGLDERWLWLENNYGMVLQLIKFDESRVRISRYLFDESLGDGEPYIRILLDYGKNSQTETRLLMQLQDKLPAGAMIELDDHYFVIDVRQLRHD
jgi:hypothetical protein